AGPALDPAEVRRVLAPRVADRAVRDLAKPRKRRIGPHVLDVHGRAAAGREVVRADVAPAVERDDALRLLDRAVRHRRLADRAAPPGPPPAGPPVARVSAGVGGVDPLVEAPPDARRRVRARRARLRLARLERRDLEPPELVRQHAAQVVLDVDAVRDRDLAAR